MSVTKAIPMQVKNQINKIGVSFVFHELIAVIFVYAVPITDLTGKYLVSVEHRSAMRYH